VITRRIATRLGLTPVDRRKIYSAGGYSKSCDVYAVNVELPNELMFSDIEVICCKLRGCDVLIGMDIISLGDMAVSNYQAQTVLSFRYPSVAVTDYDQPAP
jgi:hypothetical protein